MPQFPLRTSNLFSKKKEGRRHLFWVKGGRWLFRKKEGENIHFEIKRCGSETFCREKGGRDFISAKKGGGDFFRQISPEPRTKYPVNTTNTKQGTNLTLPSSVNYRFETILVIIIDNDLDFIVTVGSPCIGTENHPQKQRIWKKWI